MKHNIAGGGKKADDIQERDTSCEALDSRETPGRARGGRGRGRGGTGPGGTDASAGCRRQRTQHSVSWKESYTLSRHSDVNKNTRIAPKYTAVQFCFSWVSGTEQRPGLDPAATRAHDPPQRGPLVRLRAFRPQRGRTGPGADPSPRPQSARPLAVSAGRPRGPLHTRRWTGPPTATGRGTDVLGMGICAGFAPGSASCQRPRSRGPRSAAFSGGARAGDPASPAGTDAPGDRGLRRGPRPPAGTALGF